MTVAVRKQTLDVLQGATASMSVTLGINFWSKARACRP